MNKPKLRRWPVAAAALALVALVSALLLHRMTPEKRLFRSATLAQARPIEARLCGFAYAPRRRAGDAGLTALRAAATSVLADPTRDPHAAAIAALLSGESAAAVRELESLVAQQAGNPVYWSDLAAARLEHGANTADPRLDALALAAADHALRLDPQQPEALFNRALTLEALGLRFAAARAWRHYLLMDPGSSWAAEARDRLRIAEKPTREESWKSAEIELQSASDRGDVAAVLQIVRAYPQEARTSSESLYLTRWGEAFIAGDFDTASRWLTLARHIGIAVRTANGDTFIADAVAEIDRASSSRATLAAGCVTYGRAREKIAERKVADAIPLLVQAERQFSAARHPMELAAIHFHANALIDAGDRDGAAALAGQLESRLLPSYRALTAYLLWVQARIANGEGRHYETLTAASRARDLFVAMGEAANSARLHAATAAMLARLGRDREAWQDRRAALAEAAETGKWSHIEASIDAIARDEAEGPNPEIARSLLNVQVSTPSALPLTRFNGVLWRAFLDARDPGESLDSAVVRSAAMRIPDVSQRSDALDELNLVTALSAERRDPAAAERLFSEVISYRAKKPLAAHLPAVHVHRGRVRRAMGRDAEAVSDFERAIELIESRRESIRNDTLRDAFLGQSSDAYDELADVLEQRGQWQEAFEVADRTRARVLIDHAGGTAVRLGDATAMIPPDVVAAHYTTFRDRTMLVVIEHGSATHHRIGAGRATLQSLRDALTAAMVRRDNKETTRLGRTLYDLLVAPLGNRLNAALLVIVGDETTSQIPFAALQNAAGRFLAEETAIAHAPAAAAIPTAPAAFDIAHAQATIVADPAFSTELFPNLPRLASARTDAARLSGRFGHSTTMPGDRATKRALIDAARSSDAIHVAAHALSSARDASLSLIALAPSAGDGGVLYLEDIRALSLPRRPLVVLAGCETGSLGGGKGSIRSLADAFLAAGSRSVLSTLWNVEDEASSAITADFYASLARGASLPSALREAQLSAMREWSAREWAAFQLRLGVDRKNASGDTLTQ